MNQFLTAPAVLWLAAITLAGFSAQPDPHSAPPSLSPKAAALFPTSDDCVACHNALHTSDNEDVSIGTMWRSTMMANSTRDPYFQAGLRREIEDHPSLSQDIQDECAACHAPMLQRAAHADGRKAELLPQIPIRTDIPNPEHRLAADGVSCSVCHQIGSDRLGTRDSFNGRFSMGSSMEPQAFGPFAVDAGRARIMKSVTGVSQTEAPHVRDSALCATCHTLYTEARGSNGEVVGELPEQMNFQEWQHSAFYAERRSCQSCHMPEVQEPTRIASVLGAQRDGLSRHLFVGGNFLVLRMLDRFRGELGVEALSTELEATARATVRQLESETAAITLRAERQANGIAAEVAVRNLTGHKLPTGYPSRRAWVHLTARDAAGRVVFESGAIGVDGAIAGNDNDADGSAFEPHYDEIRRRDQVQIYETVLAERGHAITTGLLRATHYVKDNRLLPRGFDKATAHPDIAVHGEAREDRNFAAEGDLVRYWVPATAASIDVELRYQPVAFRWAQNLRRYEAPEIRRFTGYFSAMADQSSVVVARATGRVE